MRRIIFFALITLFNSNLFGQKPPRFERGDFITNTSIQKIVMVDYNDNDEPDFVVSEAFSTDVFELNLGFSDYYGAGGPFEAITFDVGDMDGDMLTDILVLQDVNTSINQIFLWSNVNATIDRTGFLSGGYVEKEVKEIVVKDVDSDGDVDIITRSDGDLYFTFLENDNLTFEDNVIYGWDGEAYDYRMEDFSKNGTNEIISLNTKEGKYYFSYAVQFSNTYTIYENLELDEKPSNLVIYDFDQDNDLDVIFNDGTNVNIIKNLAQPSEDFVLFSSSMLSFEHGLQEVNLIHPFDFDNDNDNDFLLSSDSKNIILRNEEGMYSTIDITDQIPDLFRSVITYDIDSDGFLDILGVGSGELYPFFDRTYFNAIPEIEDQSFTINENVENGTVIGNVNAEDAEGDAIIYRLFPYDNTYYNTFDIDTDGNIYVNDNTLIDFELSSEIVLYAIVQDQSSEAKGQSNSGNIAIHINDLDEGDIALGRGDDYLSIYPNPGSELIIAIENEYFGTIELEIFDFTGKKLFEKQLIKSERRLIDEIESNLENGVYTVKISSSDFEVVNRWIKL